MILVFNELEKGQWTMDNGQWTATQSKVVSQRSKYAANNKILSQKLKLYKHISFFVPKSCIIDYFVVSLRPILIWLNMAYLTETEIEERAQRAKELFCDGMNCAQAVVGACCDVFGMDDQELAMRLAAGFGGGMGRMRLTCGAACGMFMLAGLQNGSTTPHDSEGKMANYALVRSLADDYKQRFGSITCSELLGPGKTPCPEMIAEAVRIVLRQIENSYLG